MQCDYSSLFHFSLLPKEYSLQNAGSTILHLKNPKHLAFIQHFSKSNVLDINYLVLLQSPSEAHLVILFS